jgi:adenosylcobinamide kinase/adenosylcobinamide-phosphate guanylyltransferase
MAQVLARHSSPQRLLVIDCLTLWLTNWLMPVQTGNLKTAHLQLRTGNHS